MAKFNPLIFGGIEMGGSGGGISIGGVVAGATDGSVLFVGAGSTLTQDNANFFYNETDNRLELKNILIEPQVSAPSSPQDGQIYYNSTTNQFQFRQNGVWVDPNATTFNDSAFRIFDNLDNSKQLAFEVSGVAASTTRTITIPNANVDLGNLTDSNISPSAAITLSKLATLTINRALESNGSGVISPSVTTSTELGYLSGVTSSVQTQLNGKLNLSGGTMSGSIDMNSNTILNLPNPTLAQEPATKNYVDNLLEGLDWKTAARASSTANINLSSMPASIDGVTLNANDRFLAKDQTLPEQNGIYVFNGVGVAATRSSDMNTWDETIAAVVYVREGTLNIGTKWVSQTTEGGTLGTTPITFTVFAADGTVNGTGATNQVAYWTSPTVLAGENQLNQTRGGFGLDVSTFTGVVKASTGSFSASALVNADVDPAAAIAYSKLNLNASIVNADVANSAAIAYNKLNLANSIVDNDINTTAAIARTKIANGAAHRLVINDASGTLSDFSALTNGQLVIGSTGLAPVAATLTAGSGISITNGAGSITVSTTIPAGDIPQTSWVGPANNTADQVITGLSFANTVRSFEAMVDVYIDNGGAGFWTVYKLTGKRKALTWATYELTSEFSGDIVAGLSFNVNSSGQVRVSTGSISGYVAGETRFRAITLNN